MIANERARDKLSACRAIPHRHVTSVDPANTLMKTINQFLSENPRKVWTVLANDTVIDALRLMSEKNIGAVVVMLDNQLVGVLSERDYARKVVLMGKSSSHIQVKDIMSSRLITITTKQKIDDCMKIMTTNHIRHLPICEQNMLLGIISIGDVVKEMIKTQEIMIEHLKRYISN